MPANDKEAHVPIWFTLQISGAEAAGFWKEASGFDSESEVTETKRPRPNGHGEVVRTPAANTWGDIELKRGVDQDKTLWNWRKMVIDGNFKDARKDCTVTLLDFQGQPVLTYAISKAWPKKYSGPGLTPDSNEAAVESVTLAHEGFDVR